MLKPDQRHLLLGTNLCVIGNFSSCSRIRYMMKKIRFPFRVALLKVRGMTRDKRNKP